MWDYFVVIIVTCEGFSYDKNGHLNPIFRLLNTTFKTTFEYYYWIFPCFANKMKVPFVALKTNQFYLSMLSQRYILLT